MSARSTLRALPWVATVAALLIGCGGEPTGDERIAAGTPIVLISIDTLRADRLPAYGYSLVETPAIDALQRDAILFERAYSHVPLTLPSHTSILTGLLPPDHGVRDNLGVEVDLGPSVPYMPRRLKELGYRTGATVSTFVLQRRTGLDTDFDYYDDTRDEISKSVSLYRRGEETLAKATDWLDSVASEPFFLFFHIYDPHTPYEPVAPFEERFPVPYDAEVAYADHVVGGLLDHLRSLGLYDEALVILLSDHGEGLGDHGEYEHGVFLYNATQWVPLLVKLPDSERANTTVGRPVGLVDVYPTVLDLLGLEAPENLAGVSLLAPQVDAERNLYAETFYARAHLGWSEVTSLIGNRYQYIDAPRPELYDLLEDPAQRNNLIQTERRVAAALRNELETYDRTYVASSAEVDDETRDRLAALGYVGSVAPTDGPLADPKDRVDTLRLLKESNAKFHAEDFEGAVEGFRAVIAAEPRMVDARDTLAKALLRSGRPEQALEAYKEALEIAEGNPSRLILATARVLLGLKRLDEAKEHAELAADEVEALYMLGEIAVLQERLDDARAYVQQAVERDGAALPVKRLQASIALADGDYQGAIDLTVEAERLLADYPNKSSLKGIFMTRGKAQVQLGLQEEAESSFRREIELDPKRIQPFAHLALLYAVQNRGPEVGRTLQQLVEENPNPLAYAEAVRTLLFIGDQRSAGAVLGQALGRWPNSQQLRELASQPAQG